MTGTTIAQAIPIAISPILTRIYTPKDFGVLALFVAISAVLGSVANGRYELAIMLPRKDEDAINIFSLGIIITCFLSLLLLILVILFNDYFIYVLKNKEIGFWLYFIPIAVFFAGLFNALNYFNNRIKKYEDLRNASILKSIVLAIVQLSVGVIKTGATGLISGSIISNMFANIKLLKNISKNQNLTSKISKKKIIALSKKYSNFPKFSLPAVLLNNLSFYSIYIYISNIYAITILGFYSLVDKLLGIPTVLIGRSVGQVFFQQASDEVKKNEQIVTIFLSTIKKLILIAIPIYGIIFFVSEFAFEIIFGKNWAIAGYYAKLLSFLYFARFITSPFTVIPYLIDKVKIDFYFQSLLFFLTILTFVISYFLSLSIESYLLFFSIIIGSYYFIYTVILFILIKKSKYE
ncbi:colanic acid exporter [Campylobacter geochelonis]|nr:colanic acid exporter [Campylobacter geochelonis]CZE51405.1 colanic acid exporter [Campylobacter geochelonis]